MNTRARLVYGILAAAWAIIAIWQVEEHYRVRRDEQAKLIDLSRYVSRSLGVVLREQVRFGGAAKERLEATWNDLVQRGDLKAVALLNKDGDEMASAGPPIDLETEGLMTSGEHWGDQTVTLVGNVMDLIPPDLATNGADGPVMIIYSAGDLRATNRMTGGLGRPFGLPPSGTNNQATTNIVLAQARDENTSTNLSIDGPRSGRGRRGGGGDGRRRFGFVRPPWMSEEDYQAVIQKQGAHSFVFVLSKENMNAACSRDLWLRAIISILGAVSVVGIGLAWRNVTRSSELELRLVRAAELNSSLKEMNLAAAGLAHETRNPLNIIRGLAQMMSKQTDVPPEVRGKTKEIIDEADRVSAQLNEFINFSKPREVRRSSVALNSAVGEVIRALGSDLEEKSVRLEPTPGMPTIEADDQLLRQALFNLLLNAVQAVKRGGEIHVVAEKTGANEARIEIRDNGPGVPPERRAEIFKPYFTTQEKGTGLGLAVVQQIVRAHGWDIECLPNEPHGAVFRISHLKIAA